MAAILDPSCQLIERPRRRRRLPGKTPHADAMAGQLTTATIAAQICVDCGGLIRRVEITPERVGLILHRRPPAAMCARGYVREVREPDGRHLARIIWRGVHLEWPIEYPEV